MPPNPSPTEEVERLNPDASGEMVPGPHGRFVRLIDYRADIEAEVEKREEAEKERASLVGELARLLRPVRPRPGVTHNDAIIALVSELLIEKEAAESKLSSVVEELERRQKRADAVIAKGRAPGWFHGNSYGLGEAIVLLRDTGKEDCER